MYTFLEQKQQQELIKLFELAKNYEKRRTYNQSCKNIQVKIEKNKVIFSFIDGYFFLINKIIEMNLKIKKPEILYINPELFDIVIKNSIEKLQYNESDKCLILFLKNNIEIAVYKEKNQLKINNDITTFNCIIENYPDIEKFQKYMTVSDTHFTFLIDIKEFIELLQACEKEKIYIHIDLFNQIAPIFISNNDIEILTMNKPFNEKKYHKINLKIYNWLTKGHSQESKEMQKQNTADTPAEPVNQ
jgi:hypothetical protein